MYVRFAQFGTGFFGPDSSSEESRADTSFNP